MTRCEMNSGNIVSRYPIACAWVMLALLAAWQHAGGVSVIPGVWTAFDAPRGSGPHGKHTRMVYRAVDQRIYEIGGDYAVQGTPYPQSGRQELWRIDLGATVPAWELVHPYCLPVGSSQPERPDEAPLVYDSRRDRIWMATGSWTTNPCESTTLKGTWAYYDFADGKWHDTGVLHNKGGSKRGVYDPVTDAIYGFSFHGGKGLMVRKFDIAAGVQEEWSVSFDENGDYINNFRLFQTPIAIDPVGRVIYGVNQGTGHLFAYHIDLDNRLNGDGGNNPAFTVLLQDNRLIGKSLSESGPGTEATEGASGAVWDSANGVLLLLWANASGGITPFAYHPDSGELEVLSLQTDPPGLFPQGNSAVYDPAHNVVLTIGAAFTTMEVPNQQKLFVYQYAAGNEAGSSPPDSKPPPSASELSWTMLTPLPSLRWLPLFKNQAGTEALGDGDLVSTDQPEYRYWSYPVYAERDGEGFLFYFGGAHSDYPGNDVEVYDIAHDVWNQTRHPQVPPDGDPMYGSGGSPNVYVCQEGNPYCTPGEWQPYTIHGYGRQSYDYSTDRYVFTATGCYEVKRNARGEYDCVAKGFGLVGFDPVNHNFEMLTAVDAFNLSEQADLTEHDDLLGGIIAYHGSHGRTLVRLIKNGVVSELPTIPVDISRNGAGHGGNQSVYLSGLGKHLVATMPQGGNPAFKLWFVDFADGKAQEVPVPIDALGLVGSSGNWQMAYDRMREKLLVLQDDAGPLLRWYDPVTDIWGAPFRINGPSVNPRTASGGRKNFHYDRVNDQFLYLTDGAARKTELWVLSRGGVSMPPEPEPSLNQCLSCVWPD